MGAGVAEGAEQGGEEAPLRFLVQLRREGQELGPYVPEEAAVAKAGAAWGSPVEEFLLQLVPEPLVLLWGRHECV